MKDFSDYIDSSLKDFSDDEISFTYKKQVLDKMYIRVKELKKCGLKDENVIYDLIVDENSDIVSGYKAYLAQIAEKEKRKKIPSISGYYIMGLIIAFLFVGFVFKMWHPGWLIIEGGISILLIGLMLFAVSRLNKKKWYPLSRVLVAGSVMILAQFIFLVLRIPFHIEQAYLIFVASPALFLIGDLILGTVTKQKLIIINYLLYIPAIMALLYAILGIIGAIAWDPGWLLMIASVLIDFAILLGVIKYNQKYSYHPQEVNEE